jgi:copper chaperone CopZ
MKKLIFYCQFFLAISILVSCKDKPVSEDELVYSIISDSSKTSDFKVWGNCGMCKETIEGALQVKGVKTADWGVKSKRMTVTYDTTLITLVDIQKRIAAVGYDNVAFKGDEKAYEQLPSCCHYDHIKTKW